MRRILLIALAALAVLVIGLGIFIQSRPDEFRVSRSVVIAAPAAVVFDQVNTPRKWEAWSPWAKIDPDMQQTYSGPESGVGAKSAWVGNHEVGEGSMTITESNPGALVAFRLDFVKPFTGTNMADFTFQSEGGEVTAVTWNMTGQSNFLMKAIGLFMDCEKMCGDQFDQGLADLKAISESHAKLSGNHP